MDQRSSPVSWWAIGSLTVGAFALVTTEFLPVGLLPQIAQGVGITKGQAGLSVSIPGAVAALTAPATIAFAGRIDRRHILCGLILLLVLSNLLVAFAGDLETLLTGRIALGIAVGGFWTIGGSLGPRLRPGAEGTKATSLIFAGVSLGTIAGVPLGSLVGSELGWRTVFLASAGASALVLVALVALLPPIRVRQSEGLSQLSEIVKRPSVRIGIVATILIFVGQFAAYTYITPYLNQVSRVSGSLLSATLLAYGATGLFGNLFAGWLSGRSVRLSLAASAATTCISIVLLLVTGRDQISAITAVAIWGFGFGMLPIAMQGWLFAAAPDRLEGVQALFVAIVQAAVGSGALAGGLLVDGMGVPSALWLGAISAFLTTLLLIFARNAARIE